MSETKTQEQPTNTTQEVAKQQPKRYTGYRVEESKTIEINRAHSERRERAQVMKTISIALFGRRRFRNIYLTSSLNNFYHALMIANTLQRRVENLVLVIGLEKVKYTEFAEEGAQGVEKEYSTFSIKITREPTEEDKKHPGFNEGIDKIENPLTEIIKLGGQRRRNDKRNQGRRNYPQRREDGGKRRENVHPRRERQDRGTSDYKPQQQSQPRPHHEGDEQEFDRRRKPHYVPKVEVKREEADRPRKRIYKNVDADYDRRQPQQNIKNDKPEKAEEQEHKRGEKRTRGTNQRPQGRVAEHEYKKEHLNRGVVDREDRKDRAPPRRTNRYSSDEEY